MFRKGKCPIPNHFFVSHGDIVPKKKNELIYYKTIDSVDKEELEKEHIKSVYSKDSFIFQFCWENLWNDNVKKTEKISVGRSANNDICLPNQSISKSHGCFFLKNNDLFYNDDSSFGTTIDSKLCHQDYVEVQSKNEFKIGPYKFTLFSANDLYNRVVRIYLR